MNLESPTPILFAAGLGCLHNLVWSTSQETEREREREREREGAQDRDRDRQRQKDRERERERLESKRETLGPKNAGWHWPFVGCRLSTFVLFMTPVEVLSGRQAMS